MNKEFGLDCSSLTLSKTYMPASPSGAGGAALSALSFGLDDGTESPAASLLASEAAALGAYVTVIMNNSTKLPGPFWRLSFSMREKGHDRPVNPEDAAVIVKSIAIGVVDVHIRSGVGSL